jgi:ABC-type bacteriocin/lantibiotic exporter with double-glycine peptidase domain
MRGLGASSTVLELIDKEREKNNGSLQGKLEGLIQLQNIHFRYPTRPEARIFEDLSLVVQPGQKVGIVGKSGSGKSSLAALLLRFYDPLQGEILLDGHKLESYDLHWLRANIGYVSQGKSFVCPSL